MSKLKTYTPFYLLFILFLIGVGILLMCYDKPELHLMLNGYHSKGLDNTFKFLTVFGEWIPFAIAGIVIVWKLGAGILMLLSQGVTALLTRILKVIFAEPRPFKYFADNFPDVQLPLPDGFTPHLMNSFPSGHTATAFTMILGILFVLNLKKRTSITLASLILLILGIAVAYSRIYLSQHFAADIFAGSIVGVFSVTLVYYFLPENKPWYNYSPARHLVKK